MFSLQNPKANVWKFLIFEEMILLKNVVNLDKKNYEKLRLQIRLYDKKMKKFKKMKENPENLLNFDYRQQFKKQIFSF